MGYGSAGGWLVLWLVAGPAATSGAHLALAVTHEVLVRNPGSARPATS